MLDILLNNSFYLLASVVAIVIFISLLRTGHFIKSLLFSAVTGNLALFYICYLGAFTGVLLSINLFTVGVATLLGIPGVLSMLIIKLIFGA